MPDHPRGQPPPCVRLRDITAADLPALFEHQSDPAAVRMAVVYPRDPEAFNAHWAMVLGNPATIVRAILADDELVGYITCFSMDGNDSVGYWLARQHWGRGIATQALVLMLELVTTRPLHARVAKSNAASIRVLQKCGFVITGYQVTPADNRFPECEEAALLLV